MHDGIRFEQQTFDVISDLAGSIAIIDQTQSASELEQATMAAMDEGVDLIAGGRLPPDTAGCRVGRPDLLIRDDTGYVPVDVKHHLTLTADEDGTALVSTLASPSPDAAETRKGLIRRNRRDDALQLAHYRAILRACSHASDTPVAGIIGTEGVIVWYDLDEPLWQTPAKSDGKRRKTRSTIEVYNFEFDFRRDIATAATAHLSDPTVDLLVEPLWSAECPDCPWRQHCIPQLHTGSGDPSLLPGIGYREWRTLRNADVIDRAGLADLHYPTARIAASGVDLAKWYDLAFGAPADSQLADIWNRPHRQLETLAEAGITTVADLHHRTDPRTASIKPGGFLPEAILAARAALGPESIYRRPDVAYVTVPRVDIEIDVDMENTADGVYLWGVLITDRSTGAAASSTYRPFVTWDPLPEHELQLFEQFWTWLTTTIRQANDSNQTARIYCWHQTAETTHMFRIASDHPEMTEAVKTIVSSDQWVDLEAILKSQWITGGSTSLKAIAPIAGFAWTVEDPGGEQSMGRYEEAVDPGIPEAAREEARQWLLSYNEGDVRATLAIREFLAHSGPDVPVVYVETP